MVEFRQQAEKTPDDAAERIGCHRTKITKIENARLGISLGELRDLLRFYGVEDEVQVDEMVELARRSREPGWVQSAAFARPTYRDFIDYEKTADYIRCFETTLIAGLLQTPDYARAVVTTPPSTLNKEEVESLVEARMKRQEILDGSSPPRFCVIECEGALRLEVGGRKVMRKQLEHLEAMADHPFVDLQVIPQRAGAHAGLAGGFALFRFPTFPEVVSVEHHTGMLYMETPEDAAEYTLIFDSLRSIALSPGDSLDLIAKARQEL